MILDEGFAWNGQTFGSLSQIAKAMTGQIGMAIASSGFARERLPRQTRGADRRKSRKRTASCRANGASPEDALP